MRTGPSLFLRSDGRWEARYQKGRDEKGRIIYGFVYGSSQDEAERKRADALRKLNPDADKSVSILASLNPNVGIPVREGEVKKRAKFKYDKFIEPLDDVVAMELDSILTARKESAAVAFYLSLHLGLSISECVALRYGDIDLKNGFVRIHSAVSSDEESVFPVNVPERCVPIPGAVLDLLKSRAVSEAPKEHYLFTDSDELVSNSKTVSALFRKFIRKSAMLHKVKPTALRCTFVRRCLESNMNIETASAITGIEKNQLYKYFGMYIKPDLSAIHRIEANTADRAVEHRKLNLLILGAGSHGHNVKETAQQLGIFQEIRFLDDHISGPDIIGTCEDCYLFTKEYPCAFVAIGNNEIRKKYATMLRKFGFMLPTIIHPDATVSQKAEIGEGSVILAQATVNAAVIGDCCIVASNALVNFGATVNDYSHLDCGAMVMKDAGVPELTSIESGAIFRAEAV